MKLKTIVLLLVGTVTLSIADGASVFQRCIACHGEVGEKKSLGVSEIIAGWKEERVIERLKMYKAGKFNQYGFGNMMSGQATKLSDAEMKEVAYYVSTLIPPKSTVDENISTDEVLTPEQIKYKQFIRDYFIANPQYGTIQKANQLWESKSK
ncbi:c-type cytochrome [Sulfuricurvum sp.]|uniref:c-type cytochrome n=1 Tax=Sulfuricurvum sp. TaxID=2025608 RepID=UPI002625BA83|nr:c-type cytochrome [Sulfuricurvum sp.]MDD2780066.1 c-type cytochrome [Sulfuricurvum sp.]